MDEIVQEFLVESGENLDRMDRELLTLESEGSSCELLASIFRGIHSIKGACGFLGFNKLQALAHAGESLLSKLRDGTLGVTPEISAALLATVDGIRQMLNAISVTGQDGEETFAEVICTLQRLQEGGGAPVPVASGGISVASDHDPASPVDPGSSVENVSAPPEAGKVLKKRKHRGKTPAIAALPSQAAQETVATGPKESVPERPNTTSEAGEGGHTQEEAHSRAESFQESTIRVNVTLLDRLMNLVGELVLARNQILQCAGEQKDTAFQGSIQQLNLVTSELREGVMKTRMQPISRLFDKVPRVVRDVSLACGKRVRIETEGKDTELDRTLLEAINDPLTHLVRNAIDHGIEPASRRLELGKPAEGLLILRALHEGGQVTIEIKDDGAGIDAENIRKKAVKQGAVTSEQAARMHSAEALHLIFLPGVSTAEKITNVSGRGVGLDVVKTNIERVGGSVEIQTRVGEGTTFRIKVPLTLAIVPALIVRSAGKSFAIPQVNLVELVGLEPGQVAHGIEMVHGAAVYRLRGSLLPLVDLNHELGLTAKRDWKAGESALNIVVVQVDSRRFGLVVDEVHDAEEIVVKPLGKQLKGIRAYAGATVMGDGKLALILDVPGLASAAGLASEAKEQAPKGDAVGSISSSADKQNKFVLFAGPGGTRMALPLESLARLEELPVSKVERSGTRWVVQYRGHILPLVQIDEGVSQAVSVTGTRAKLERSSGTVPVLVVMNEGNPFGLMVDRILDIVEESAEVRLPATRPGVLYSAVIAEHVTELLDIPAIWRASETGVSLPDPPPSSRSN